MLTRFVTNLLTYAKAHPRAIAFALTAPWPVPQSLQTVLALYATQHHLTGVSPQAVAAVWTFLLGALVQPQQVLTVDWTVSALKKLVAIPTLKASDSSETADNF